MPTYQTPGVYVEEVPSAVKPIAGVGTSTAGFIGVIEVDASTMPNRPGTETPFTPTADNVAVQIDSWTTFLNNFGEPSGDDTVLADAVYGFFNNGGGLCYVVATPSIGAEDVKKALALFETIDEIAIVAAPGAVDPVTQTAIVNHCEALQDRFAILDGVQEGADASKIKPLGLAASSYAAIYYPWLDIGKTAEEGEGDAKKTVVVYQPPSGHLAGIYARVDGERGVFKAPANEVIRGVVGLEHLVSKAAQGPLNEAHVNVIRTIGGSATVWGARTLAGADEPEWKYIAARRLFSYLRESIEDGVQWTVFEPNTPDLWSKVRRNVGAFLTTTWESGALLGATPAEAFYVRCDATNNPPEIRDLGQLVTEIGVALVQPAEFVIFRISQWSGPASS